MPRYWIAFYRGQGIDLFNIQDGGGIKGTRGWLSRQKNPKSKLKEEQVKSIRLLHKDGHTTKDLAAQFGVSHSLIEYIIQNKKWYDPDYIPIPKNRFHFITESEAVEIRKLHNDGMSRDDLRIKFDSSSNVIQEIIANKRFPDPNYIRRDGNWRKPFKFSEERANEIKKLRNEYGYNLKELCEMFKVGYGVMKYFADGKRHMLGKKKRINKHVEVNGIST